MQREWKTVIKLTSDNSEKLLKQDSKIKKTPRNYKCVQAFDLYFQVIV